MAPGRCPPASTLALHAVAYWPPVFWHAVGLLSPDSLALAAAEGCDHRLVAWCLPRGSAGYTGQLAA